MNLLVINGSSRRNGNTAALSEVVLNQLDKVNYNNISLLDYDIKPIVDERHEINGFTEVDDDYEKLIKLVFESDAVLFATPLYWYNMSGLMKTFIDRWSQSLRSTKYDFKNELKNKKIYLLVVGGKTADLTSLPLIQQFNLLCQYLEMNFAGYVIGKGVEPKEVLKDDNSITAAKNLAKKIKDDLS